MCHRGSKKHSHKSQQMRPSLLFDPEEFERRTIEEDVLLADDSSEKVPRFSRNQATDHALDDLTDAKVRDPNDPTAERMVSLFRLRYGDQVTCPILGLYHRNFADARIHISIKSGKRTIPLSEPQLLAE